MQYFSNSFTSTFFKTSLLFTHLRASVTLNFSYNDTFSNIPRFNSETRAAGKWLFSEASIRRRIVHRRCEFLSDRRSPSGKSRKLSGDEAVGSFRKLHLHPPSGLAKEKYCAEEKFTYYNANGNLHGIINMITAYREISHAALFYFLKQSSVQGIDSCASLTKFFNVRHSTTKFLISLVNAEN